MAHVADDRIAGCEQETADPPGPGEFQQHGGRVDIRFVGPDRIGDGAEHRCLRGEVHDEVCSRTDGPGGDSRVAKVADHGADARLGRLAPVCHSDVGAAFEQCPDEPPPDETRAAGHQYLGTLSGPHRFSIRVFRLRPTGLPAFTWLCQPVRLKTGLVRPAIFVRFTTDGSSGVRERPLLY